MLELMHFADELADVDEFRTPKAASPGKKELEMAKSLIGTMTEKWKPEAYKDEYSGQLEKIIHEKVKAGGKALPKLPAKEKPANVIDLMSALKESLAAGKKKKPAASEKPRRKRAS